MKNRGARLRVCLLRYLKNVEPEDADAKEKTAISTLCTVLKGYRAMPLEQYGRGKSPLRSDGEYKLKIPRLNCAYQLSNIEILPMDLAAPRCNPIFWCCRVFPICG